MEAIVGRVGQVQWALAAHLHVEKGMSWGVSERCGYGVVRRNPAVRCKGGRREEVLKVRAVRADGGGGEGNGGERFGRGGGGGDNGGDGGDGRSESSDRDDAGAPEVASGLLAWYVSLCLNFGILELILENVLGVGCGDICSWCWWTRVLIAVQKCGVYSHCIPRLSTKNSNWL